MKITLLKYYAEQGKLQANIKTPLMYNTIINVISYQKVMLILIMLKTFKLQKKKNETEEVYVIDKSCFQNAKQQELENWKSNNVYIEVAKSDQPLLNCRWVCSIKNNDDKQIPKAPLVAKSFEEQTSDILKDSPTCSREGLHFVLALIAHNEKKINSINIKTAFSQGEETD